MSSSDLCWSLADTSGNDTASSPVKSFELDFSPTSGFRQVDLVDQEDFKNLLMKNQVISLLIIEDIILNLMKLITSLYISQEKDNSAVKPSTLTMVIIWV